MSVVAVVVVAAAVLSDVFVLLRAGAAPHISHRLARRTSVITGFST